ncbi:lytic murein transglycosylase [Sulfitobacter donghicola]|uniref:Murein transglycosylase n=1 Tax=Sulfitobacter donghicola DSW-25 = KCTC 12864 = JCM 14565 TaxID=1300350 RepID=A0A073ILH2_9RHOB|nr:lytic murein transglycosylase [Sulfitobacter donghicola]KEJ90574.1 murein transglycosylase [Sulfitobacter donghicola DSW-25 = KCTC 12864 = JCM 14565]KIN67821.1 Peptidoglycan binding domain protein [Sulfitobacter donghicola DSW-25 = KCTC 12864 = JCM 14565]
MRALSLALLCLTSPALAQTNVVRNDAGLQQWIDDFRSKAIAAGISAKIYDTAMAEVSYSAKVVERDRNQSEFTKTIWDYLGTAVSDLRISNGKAALGRQRETLKAVEERYGVPAEIITAIWGLESAYGTFRGSDPVLTSMASLAYDARRAEFFETQVIAALQIVQTGDTQLSSLKGSWAGAMGHTQFMPGSFIDHAVDWTGDGRRDIWGDDPRDALASAAAYLKDNGWVTGQPWGVEVQLPDGFDYLLANREVLKAPSEWAEIGILDTKGLPVSDHGQASILLPAGAEGAAFMIFKNFEVLESYNTADAYVIAVGHLADRISGAGPLRGDWPRQDRPLSFDERIELQKELTAQGFDTQKIDAKIGPLTVNAVRGWQVAHGLVPDGYASPRFLERLRSAR